MKCPFCGLSDTRVVDSRPAEDGVALRRRRQCDGCRSRFTTYERAWQTPITVVKKDGRREEFSREKLQSGIGKACNKRPVPTQKIMELVEDVEAELRRDGLLEVDAETVGEMAMMRLLQLDEVAYVRFASVYHRFNDVKRFAQFLDRMSKRVRRHQNFAEEAEQGFAVAENRTEDETSEDG